MPAATFFKPQGVSVRNLHALTLSIEGYEAFRLVDGEGLSQEEAAVLMDVSRPTLCRILMEARQTVARSLAGGMALRIEGGSYRMADDQGPGNGSGRRRHGRR
jgi:predicted DNA-binding protein (UPF0251 family)